MRLSKMIRSMTYGLKRWGGKVVVAVFFSTQFVQAAEIRIVALGDSLTQGYGLPQWEGFVPVMEGWLRDQNINVQIINAGVSGDTTSGGLERAEWALYGDNHAMILAMGGNDMLRGFPPSLVRDNLGKIIEIAIGYDIDVLLVGMKATNNFGQTYKDQFDAIYPWLADHYGVQLYDDFIGAISADRSMAEIQEFMQGDGLHPNAQGIRMVVDEMGYSVLGLIDRMDHW
ncbi:MAG: arylesterase [Paracoccaceae bacterium]|jgi:acyl-CoA thioesterase I|nr:arylesterase [Paracoccaceae bacterium]